MVKLPLHMNFLLVCEYTISLNYEDNVSYPTRLK